MSTHLNNLTIEQIIARIEERKDDGNSAIKEICVCLLELSKRSVKHPLHRDRVYRWYAHIAGDKLHAGLAAMFNGNPRYLDHVCGRNMDLQKAMFSGVEYEIARVVAGEVKVVRKNVAAMSLAEFQRLFPKDRSPATISEQQAQLAVQLAENNAGISESKELTVRVAEDRLSLSIGRNSVRIATLLTALESAGYIVQPKQE